MEVPTSAGGTTYGPGTNGQVLKSNGTSSYWGNSIDSSIAPVEDTNIASEYHEVYDPFTMDGILYDPTTDIATGETIAPGTNVTPITVKDYFLRELGQLGEFFYEEMHGLKANDIGAVNKGTDFVISSSGSWINFLNISLSSYPSKRKFVLHIAGYTNIAIISIYIYRNNSLPLSVGVRANILTSSLYTATDFCYKIDSSTGTISFYLKKKDDSVTIQILYNSGINLPFQDIAISELPSGVSYFAPMQDGAGNEIPSTYATKTELNQAASNIAITDLPPDHTITTDDSSGGWYNFLNYAPAALSGWLGIAFFIETNTSFYILTSRISGRSGTSSFQILGGDSGNDFICYDRDPQDYWSTNWYMNIPNNSVIKIWVLYCNDTSLDNQGNHIIRKPTSSSWKATLQSAQPSGFKPKPVTGFTKNGTITLSLSWSGSGPYTQTVTVSGTTITEKSSVTLRPTAAQLSQLITDGVTAITIENNAGTLTAYALGGTNSTSMTIQCTVQELIS